MKCVCGHDIGWHTEIDGGSWRCMHKTVNKYCRCPKSPEEVADAIEFILRARIAAMREYLIDWEFAAGDEDGLYCSTCNGRKEKGHKPDCAYAALLKESEE